MKIELREIHKYYGPIKANCGVNLTIEPGVIHGILGENGAGKTTLMKILAGYSQKTTGTILVDRSPSNYKTPAQASELGIGMLYQDPLDFPLLSVLDNFMLGQTTGIVNKKKTFRKIFEKTANSLNFSLQPDVFVNRLTIGERQQLEILRLLARGIQVLILDEPTTGISNLQKKTLFQALKKLASEGKSVILVSHKLEDVEALCDKIAVLRQGALAGEMERPFNTNTLLEMMFGDPPLPTVRTKTKSWNIILEMNQVSAIGGRTGLKNCDITFRQGEVIGLAGLEGSGQDVFLRIAAGINQPTRGSIYIKGVKMDGRDYHGFKNHGVTYLPASRLEEGLILGLNIAEHIALLDKHKGFFVRRRNAFQTAEKKIAQFRIKGEPESKIESLSGGNQQRLLLSFLPDVPVLLLLGNPTRGLDMESVLWVWQHLHQYCEHKACIVFSSSDLDEILMNADRVLVFFNGIVIKDARTDQTDAHELGRAIAGKT
ncbi:MAG: ATP-binding cassette domain-containing protein [Deltaproteobacteria bacterium]|jgi:simple sugar transport system ATP-binding protein|nr:ATP-binding cassette domain-containing protein [Deltaproteobacteria bacterium]